MPKLEERKKMFSRLGMYSANYGDLFMIGDGLREKVKRYGLLINTFWLVVFVKRRINKLKRNLHSI